MSLENSMNVVPLKGHSGRHTTAYHDFMLSNLRELDAIAMGNQDVFKKGFFLIVDFLVENPWLPYAK